MEPDKSVPLENLDWIQVRSHLDSKQPETAKEKMLRKIKENPVVPIGCVATASALSYGLYQFRKGNQRMSQIMMRTRILAQGLTVAALIGGIAMTCARN